MPLRLFSILLLFLMTPAAPAPAQENQAPAAPDQIQNTINLLEDEQRRREVITLLKVMAAVDGEMKAGGLSAAAPAGAGPPSGLKARFSAAVEGAWRDFSASGAGLKQAGREMRAVFQALAAPAAAAMWRPYALKILLWGCFCLLLTQALIMKFGRRPAALADWTLGQRLAALLKYVLVMAGPNLVLIVSLLGLPALPSTAPGVTADLATGLLFVRSLVQHFFVNLSALYVSLRVAEALFAAGGHGYAVIRINPALASHFLHTWRAFAVYLAVYVFIRETFLEHFVSGSLYVVAVTLMTLPLPVYLSFRLLRLKRLFQSLRQSEAALRGGQADADALANSDSEAETVLNEPANEPFYRADRFFKRHWATAALIGLWSLALISLCNPVETSVRFGGLVLLSILLPIAAALLIKAERRLVGRWLGRERAQGPTLAQNVDSLSNLVVWLGLVLALLNLWGLPLVRLLESELTRDLAGRALTIGVTLAVLPLFIRFSRLVTDQLLAIPSLAGNRNWRTMTPLVLTAARALAIFLAVVVILDRLGVNVGPILAGAGILGLGVGLGAQSLVKDIINGISILMMDTLSVGDVVSLGGKSGTVEALGLRSIRLRDTAGNLTVVPNSSVEVIVNMTRDYSQDLIEFTVPYDADPDAMLKLADEVADDLSRDPVWSRQLTAPASVMGITAFDPGGTTIRLQIKTLAGQQWSVGRELRLRLKRRMLQEGLKSTWFGQNIFFFKGEPEKEASAPGEPETAPPADGRRQDGAGPENGEQP